MFGARQNFVRRAVVAALKTPDPGAGESRAQIRIFASAFGNSSPARVPGDIEHRRKGPTHSGIARFLGGDTGRALRQTWIPTARLSQWDGEDGAVTMDHIEA